VNDPRCKTLAFWWPEFPLSSKLFRYAALSIASSQYAGGKLNLDTMHYLQNFYCTAKETMMVSSLREIIFASYAMQLYTIAASDEPLTALLVHFKGMCEAVYALLSQELAPSQFLSTASSVLALWMMGLYVLDQLYWASVEPTNDNSQNSVTNIADKMYEVLDCPASMACLNFVFIKATRSRIWIQYHEALRVYFAFHLDLWLEKTFNSRSRRDPIPSTSFQHILRLILEQTPQAVESIGTQEILDDSLDQLLPLVSFSSTRPVLLSSPDAALLESPNLYDMKAMLFVACATLTREIQKHTNNGDNTTGAVISAANKIALLCAAALASPLSQTRGLWVCRSLVWAGIILTRFVNPISIPHVLIDVNA
jgi:hypothetical protein